MKYHQNRKRVELEEFIAQEDYEFATKPIRGKIAPVNSSSKLAEVESGVRDHQSRVSQFHLRFFFISGLFPKKCGFSWKIGVFLHCSISSMKLWIVRSLTQVLRGKFLYEVMSEGFHIVQKKNFVRAILHVNALKKLPAEGLTSNTNCNSIELFVYYGPWYWMWPVYHSFLILLNIIFWKASLLCPVNLAQISQLHIRLSWSSIVSREESYSSVLGGLYWCSISHRMSLSAWAFMHLQFTQELELYHRRRCTICWYIDHEGMWIECTERPHRNNRMQFRQFGLVQ